MHCSSFLRRRTWQAPAYNEWQRQQQAKVNLNQPVGLFKDMVHSWPQRLPGMEVEVKAMNQSALPPFVFPGGAPFDEANRAPGSPPAPV